MHHKRHRDHETFDEVRIRTVIRRKESHLSGDEYRTSAVVELIHKGQVVVTERYRDVQTAVQCLGGLLVHNSSPLPDQVLALEKQTCDQPGCPEPATVRFSLRKLYSRSGQEWTEPANHYRQFCQQHSNRGDCGQEDADRNYSAIEAPEDRNGIS